MYYNILEKCIVELAQNRANSLEDCNRTLFINNFDNFILVKPLIAIPSPRQIKEVKEALDQITYIDKLWIKYHYPEITAYTKMRYEFLYHDYTHLIICPDDLVIENDKLDLLIDDYNHIINAEDKIVSGYCNVDSGRFFNCANITLSRVNIERYKRLYSWLSLDQIDEIRNSILSDNPLDYLIECGFAGFGCFIIPRKIVQHIPFRNDSPTGNDFDGGSLDLIFCSEVIEENYKILCDTRCRFRHLKISDSEFQNFYAGKRKPYIYYEKGVKT